MAYTVLLCGTDGRLSAEVAPIHGGMISQIYLGEEPVLTMDRSTLETAPMAAGGIPLLFPFPSKTRDDQYTLHGKTFWMPMHGLVKNAAFAVKDILEDTMTVWVESNPAWQAQCYPFDFHLEVRYRIAGNCLHMDTAVTNRSSEPMPYSFGWHPFFYASDKTKVFLKHTMTTHYDYVHCADSPAPEHLTLSDRLDDVFHTPAEHSFTLTNLADGYEVECQFDSVFQAMVVCTWVRDSICVEPWCGLPDAVNQNRFLQWVPPGMTAEHGVTLRFRKCGGSQTAPFPSSESL